MNNYEWECADCKKEVKTTYRKDWECFVCAICGSDDIGIRKMAENDLEECYSMEFILMVEKPSFK
jgi:hypothetical protein